MKIKAYLKSGGYKMINVSSKNDIERIAEKFSRWEYSLWLQEPSIY